MPTVAGTFPDIAAAHAAFSGVTGAPPPATPITAIARADARGLATMRGVRWVRAASGDGIQNQTETTTAGALLGLFVAGLLAYAPGAYGFVRAWMAAGPLRAAAGAAAGSSFEFPAVVVVGILLVGAVAGAWAGWGFGLPRGLAYRYGLQLRRGRVLVSVRVPQADVARMTGWLHIAGASDVRVCDGRLRLRAGAQPDSLDLPATVRR